MCYQISLYKEANSASGNEADLPQEVLPDLYVRQTQQSDNCQTLEGAQKAEIDNITVKTQSTGKKYSFDIPTKEEDDLSSLASSYKDESVDSGLEIASGYVSQMANSVVVVDDDGQGEFSLSEGVYDLDSDVGSSSDMDYNLSSTNASNLDYVDSDKWPTQSNEPCSNTYNDGGFYIDLDDVQTHPKFGSTSNYIQA